MRGKSIRKAKHHDPAIARENMLSNSPLMECLAAVVQIVKHQEQSNRENMTK
jgi:hypothetical protein